MSPELAVFGTPWHWLAHGLGVGQQPEGFDPARAVRVLSISDSVNRRFESDSHRFVDALVRAIVSHCEVPLTAAPSSLMEALLRLRGPYDHARACALLIESLAKIRLPSPDEARLEAQWAAALKSVTAVSAASDSERYRNLHLLVNLFLAAGQAGWTNTLSSQSAHRAYQTAWRLVDSIKQPFYRTRAAAILVTVLSLLGRHDVLQHDGQDRVADLIELNAAEFQRVPSYRFDGVHFDRDFRLFPLLLSLSAIAVSNRFDCLHCYGDWLSTAAHEIRALNASSRASQSLFWVSAMRNLGMLSTYVRDPRSFVHETIQIYLENTDGQRPDDYLRCTYLVHLARQLGCPDLISHRIWEIVAKSVTDIIGSDLYRENPYASGFMIVAYALSTTNAREPGPKPGMDLTEAVFRIEHEPAAVATQLPRLGFSLVDAALRLRKAESAETSLFEAVHFG